MAAAVEESSAAEKGGGEYTQDGSVDLRGNPVLRSKRGGWTACSFIVVYELFERMAYYGIASNLVIYLTEKLHQGTVEASNNVTNWSGTIFFTTLLGAYVADAYLGRYWTFVVGSAIYFMGMVVLTLSVTVRQLKPPACSGGEVCPAASALQLGAYFGGLYIIAFGNGDTKPNISTIGPAAGRRLDRTGAPPPPLPLTIFVLLPQFVLMGVADAFVVVGKIEFFYDQAPESMKSLGTAISLMAYGVGSFLSSFLLAAVSRFTRERGTPWVTNNLNASRLDLYYAFLAALGAANCVAFAVLAGRYKYRSESTETIDVVVDAAAQVQLEAPKKIHLEPMAA